MADATAQAKERLTKGTELRAKMVEEVYGTQGKPTPTQEECDLAALGIPVEEHEDDGSGPESVPQLVRTKQSEAKPAGGSGSYTTRSVEPPRERAPADRKT